MTARSKVTLVEAQQIRVQLLASGVIAVEDAKLTVMYPLIQAVVDGLMASGLIDTDAALRIIAGDE